MEFSRDRDRFFDPLVAFLCNYSGVTLTLKAHQKPDGIITRFAQDDRIGFKAAVARHVIVFATAPILDAVAQGDWVDTVPYDELPIPTNMPRRKIPHTGRVHDLSTQALFVQFYDGVEEQAEANHDQPLVRFSKAIRNACAHGGVFSKLDDRARLNWKALDLKAASNGRTLLEVGLDRGDLIALMRELDEALPR